MKHKHCELIKAWADGATIERLWTDINHPNRAWWMIDYQPDWDEYLEYRIKPEPKPDIRKIFRLEHNSFLGLRFQDHTEPLRSNEQYVTVYFDGETGKLKSAEVLK